MKTDWHYDYAHRFALDEGEKLTFCETDWELVPVGRMFLVIANGEVARRFETFEDALEELKELNYHL